MTAVIQLQELLLPLGLFTLLATGTQGPNKILLIMSGSQFGLRKTVPFIIGMRFAIDILFILMGTSIGVIIEANPNWHFTLKLIGACYLVYLAINNANQPESVNLLGFKQGVLLQFINPKSIVMILSCISVFSLPGELYTLSVIQAFVVFTLVGIFCNGSWVMFGVGINKLLSSPKTHLNFNRTLALLTLLVVVLLFY